MLTTLDSYDAKNRKLQTDNKEYVQQIISMKENRAQIMNDAMTGRLTSDVSTSGRSKLRETMITLRCVCRSDTRFKAK